MRERIENVRTCSAPVRSRLVRTGHLALLCAVLCGCSTSSPKADRAIFAYFRHDYPTARDAIRVAAADRKDSNVVLNNLRLGLAAMADGDHDEAELALMRAYEYLRSGGVNAEDRVAAATFVYEGLKVWKGEPFEQAMGFYYVAALHLVKQDWENARAAAANSLFALQDLEGGADVNDPKYRRIESQFTLGYLVAAISEQLMRRPEDARPMFQRVRELQPKLGPLVDALEGGAYNTLLLIDAGRGPRKRSYGMDDAKVRFEPDGRTLTPPMLSLAVDGRTVDHAGGEPVVDLWTLSQFPRWWSLETSRKIRSGAGNVMLIGGLGAAGVGAANDRTDVALAGLGAAAAGMLLKASAKADTRHLELLPRNVYIVPLLLPPGDYDIALRFGGSPAGTFHDLPAGVEGRPNVFYLRLQDAFAPLPDEPLYTVEAADYREGDKPWVLGGTDLTPPSEAIAAKYRSAGVLPDATESSLRDLYKQAGFVLRAGPQGADPLNPRWYRHVTEGGVVLFAPLPGTHSYERITRLRHPPYAGNALQ